MESRKDRGILLWKSKWNCEETPAAWPTRARARTRTSIIIATRISVTVLQEPDAATTQTASEYWTAATRPKCEAQRPSMKCFKCNGLEHMAKECRRNLDIRGMTYEEMAEHFEAAAKNHEELAKKKYFPAATQ